MSNFNMHQIKRQARKEAWYGDSWNPFGKGKRSTTWASPSPLDIESGPRGTRGRTSDDGCTIRKSESGEIGGAGPVAEEENGREEEIIMEEKARRRFVGKFFKEAKRKEESKSNRETQVDLFKDDLPDLDGEGLSWDPFGWLSEKSTTSSYQHHTVRVLQSEKRQRLTAMQKPRQMLARDICTNVTTAPVPSLQDAKLQNIDVHIITVTATSVHPTTLVYDLSDLLEICANKPAHGPSARVYVIEDSSPSLMETLSQVFGCNVEVFRDHMRRAGEDVALVLPSTSRRQSHVVIPYRRTYQPSSRKEIRDSRNLRSSFSHGGLVTTEEHVTCWLSPAIDGSWTSVILCDPNPIQSGDRSSNDECMRSRFETTIQAMPPQDLLSDPYMIIRKLLELVSANWTKVIRDQEGYMLPGLKPQYTGATDVRLSEKESFGEYLKQTLGMLKMDLQIFYTLRPKSPSFAQDPDELLGDYEFLLSKASAQIEQNTSSIPVITAMIAVEESRKAIQQANDVKALTTLATVYIPLSFVAGIFGMNVTQLNPNPLVNIPLWMYFAIALPITAASMLLVWYWGWLLSCVAFIRQRCRRPTLKFSKKKLKAIEESPLTNALVNAGTVGVLAGPGKPRVNHGNFLHMRK